MYHGATKKEVEKMEKEKVVRKLVLVAMIGVLLTGCASNPLKIPKCDMTNATVLGESEGRSTGYMFGFVPYHQNTRFVKAYKDAIDKLGGTCLVDPVIEEKWLFAQLFTSFTFKIKGTVVTENKQADAK